MALAAADRFVECAFWRPATAQPMVHGPSGYAALIDPFAGRLCLAVHSHEHGSSIVVRLFLSRDPSAVLRRVWAVVVDAVQGVIRRACAHVAQESDEVGAPPLAHANPAAPVVSVLRVSCVVTAVLRSLPRVVLRAARARVRRSSAPVTAASLRFARHQPVSWSDTRGAALAATEPPSAGPSGTVRCGRDNGPASECLSEKGPDAGIHVAIVTHNMTEAG